MTTPTTPSTTQNGGKPEKKIEEISSKDDFNEKLIAAGSKLILVQFHAPWCGPCKMIGPKIEQLANLFLDKAVIIKVDVDDFEDIAIEYNVTSMPTFLFLKNKKQVEFLVGSTNEKELEKTFTKYCGEAQRASTQNALISDPEKKQ